MRGELVGINTGIFSQSGGYQGIGFAVPSNLARHVVDDLMKYGEVRRGTIGGIVRSSAHPAAWREELGVPRLTARSSPAWRATRRRTERGCGPAMSSSASTARPFEDPSQLFRVVADARIGSTATVKVERQGRSSS